MEDWGFRERRRLRWYYACDNILSLIVFIFNVTETKCWRCEFKKNKKFGGVELRCVCVFRIRSLLKEINSFNCLIGKGYTIEISLKDLTHSK